MKNVYSIVLSSDVVEKIDRLADFSGIRVLYDTGKTVSGNLPSYAEYV